LVTLSVTRRRNFGGAGADVRVLVTGGAGLVGSALIAMAPEDVDVHATQRDTPVVGATAHTIDLADPDDPVGLLQAVRPDVVIHTAYGKDDLERDVIAASRSIAAACAIQSVDLVHLSSDVVFDGEHAPYAEDDPLVPVHAYGRAKAEAEGDVRTAVPDAAVVRTSLVLRADPLDVTTAWIVDALRAGEPLHLFTDEIRCPIRADDLARMLWDLVALPSAERAGPWHLVGPEALSRHALGLLLADAHGLDPSGITAASSRDVPSAEPRPRDLTLTAERASALPTRPRSVATLWH
jgi:dTDP-4-dehydrorhamnose reductase